MKKITTPFIDDIEKMKDFYTLSKEEFLKSYSYLKEEDYNATMKHVKSQAPESRL